MCKSHRQIYTVISQWHYIMNTRRCGRQNHLQRTDMDIRARTQANGEALRCISGEQSDHVRINTKKSLCSLNCKRKISGSHRGVNEDSSLCKTLKSRYCVTSQADGFALKLRLVYVYCICMLYSQQPSAEDRGHKQTGKQKFILCKS